MEDGVRPSWRTGKNVSTFRFGKHSMDVLITGVGMTAMAFYLGKVINRKYDFALNAGVAGSFRKKIPPGKVVNVVSDCFADLGAEDGNKFLTAEEIGLQTTIRQKPQVTKEKMKSSLLSLPAVKGITVNTVHGNPYSIRKIIKKFNPDIETMEGAAFFLTCSHEKIPCIQIRAISNYVERRNKKNWKMNLAVENLCAAIEKILQKL